MGEADCIAIEALDATERRWNKKNASRAWRIWE